MKKRLFIIIGLLLLLTGCGNKNTPTAIVEAFFGKYQSMDSEVLAQLDKTLSNDNSMSDEQRKDYQGLMEKQYQNLSYKILDERIDGDMAEVDVEIEVFDYATSISKSREYYKEHRDEFDSDDSFNEDMKDESGEIVGGAIDDVASFIEYKIKQLLTVTDKTKYEMTFYLSKSTDGDWMLEDLSDVDRQKLHGLYEK